MAVPTALVALPALESCQSLGVALARQALGEGRD